jgi:hypothetical protein
LLAEKTRSSNAPFKNLIPDSPLPTNRIKIFGKTFKRWHDRYRPLELRHGRLIDDNDDYDDCVLLNVLHSHEEPYVS